MLPNPKFLNPSSRLLATIFSIGVALGSGLGYGFSQVISDVKQQKPIIYSRFSHFSLAEYERLQLGMSIAEVEAILYRGTEVKRSQTMVTFVWENPDAASKIIVTFETGKLKSKEQFGLK